MPPNVRTLRYTQRALEFNGGLNIAAPPTEIADNELVACTNFYIDESGTLRKRPGAAKDAAVTGLTGATQFVGADWLSGRIIIPVNGPAAVVYQTGTATALTGYPALQGLRWGLYINGINYLGFSYAPGAIRILTGTAIGAAIANSPGSTTAVWHKSRIFTNGEGVLGTESRVYFSNPNAPGTWSTTDTLDIGTDDREQITAFASMGDLLYIFKQDSIWSLYVQGTSPVDWVVRRVSNNLGSIASGQYAVLVDKNVMYFISKAGVYLSNGASFSNITENIWDIILKTQLGSSSRIVKWGNYLVFNAGLSSAQNRTFVYNLKSKAWTEWVFFGGSQLTDIFVMPYVAFGNGGSLLALAAPGGNVAPYLIDEAFVTNYTTYAGLGYSSLTDGWTTTLAGTTVTSQFTSKEFSSFVDWYWRNRWNSLEYIANGSPTFNMIGDGSARPSVTPGFHATLRKAYKIHGADRARVFQLNCVHALTSPFEFYRGEMHFTLKTHISASGTP